MLCEECGFGIKAPDLTEPELREATTKVIVKAGHVEKDAGYPDPAKAYIVLGDITVDLGVTVDMAIAEKIKCINAITAEIEVLENYSQLIRAKAYQLTPALLLSFWAHR